MKLLFSIQKFGKIQGMGTRSCIPLDNSPYPSDTSLMTASSLKAHLEVNRPPVVASCYELAGRYRVAEDTARNALKANGYVYDEDSRAWVRRETQLDRIERMLINLHTVLELAPVSNDTEE